MDRLFNTLRRWGAPALLLFLSFLAFGLLIPWLGLYWDDWAKLLVGRLVGLQGYWAYYAEDRPLSAWTHIVFTPLLGYRPAAWQMANLLLRWLSAWGMFWSLNGLWPRFRRQNLVASALFLLYPVFLQQPAAVTFHQQWLQFALFFCSLGAMIRAFRAQGRARWAWSAASLLAMLLQLSVTEYFVPLELVRLPVLFLLAGNHSAGNRAAVHSAAAASLPYLAVLALYIGWRLFLIPLPGDDPYRAEMLYAFFSDPAGTLRALLPVVAIDLERILFSSWMRILPVDLVHATRFTWLSIAGGMAGAFAMAWLRMESTGSHPAETDRQNWLRQALVLGLAALLLGPVPAWITGRQVVFDAHSDRYALPAMFGAALLVTAAIEWLTTGRRVQSSVLAAALISTSMFLHIRTANEYRWLWTEQQRFFWQLSWRAPHLKPQTALFLENEPFPNQGLFSTSSALNLLYPQDGPLATETIALDYWIYALRPRYNHAPDSMEIGLRTRFRTLSFESKTPQSLLLYQNPQWGSCLWVLSERDHLHPYLPDLVKSFLPISNLGQIERAARAAPPADLFGREPAHTWCYYFEQAELARQFDDWDTAAALASEALSSGYLPGQGESDSPYEWLPLVEGLARTGRWQEAADLTTQSLARDPAYGAMYCSVWKSIAPGQPVIEKQLPRLGCP